MGTLKSGSSIFFSTQIGSFENGTVYKGLGIGRTAIGEYKHGSIYDGIGCFNRIVGTYSNGDIYEGDGPCRTLIGFCKNGDIYKGVSMFYATQIGQYDGDIDGACAAAFLLLLR